MRIKFIDPQGTEHVVDAEVGESAMQCATRHLVPGIVGECCGAMACATCHGYVDKAWLAKISSASLQENEMLEGCIDVQSNSRLTCQIILDAASEGLIIQVPQSQT